MARTRLLAAGVLSLVAAIAVVCAAWALQPATSGGPPGVDPAHVVGVAGPAGPQQLSPVPAYFARATYSGYQLTQFQYLAARLPAGRYFVEVRSPGSLDAADCLGVSFPLVPPQTPGATYSGYVTVARSGDEVAVSCFEEPPSPTAKVSFELYVYPVAG